jgi:hypothetical protein
MSDAALVPVVAVVAVIAIIVIIVAVRRRTTELPVDQARLRELQTEWRAPAELQSNATPRNVRYTNGARALLVLMAAIAVGAVTAAAFLVPAVRQELQDNESIRSEGVPGGGTVTSLWADSGKSTSYHVAYTYAVGDNRYASKATVSRESYDRLSVGATTALHYAPSRPEVSRMDDAVNEPPWLKLLMFIPLSLLALVPWRLIRVKKLLAWGTPVGAIVTRSAPTKGGLAIRYQFLDPSGEVVTGSEVVPSRGAPQAGETITVLFDPDRPRRTGRYPIRMVRLGE